MPYLLCTFLPVARALLKALVCVAWDRIARGRNRARVSRKGHICSKVSLQHLNEPTFPFPLCSGLQATAMSDIGYAHIIFYMQHLWNSKIKNVADHKYLRSPGAGICTVFKQTFLIWYLGFFSVIATCLLHSSLSFLFFPPPFPSLAAEFHIALAQQQQSIPNPTAQLHGQEVMLQHLLTPLPSLSAFHV